MAVFVDDLWWHARREWCHLWTDGDIEELHRFAASIGLKRAWFQEHPELPHYDLTASKRVLAVKMGAVPQTMREMVAAIKERRNANNGHQ